MSKSEKLQNRKLMTYLFTIFFVSFQIVCMGQINKDSIYPGLLDHESRELKFEVIDLKIIERADEILSDASKWHKNDDRICEDDIGHNRFSLFCSLYKASIDIAGSYEHRRAAMQIVRFIIETHEKGRVKEHRLMDWNNHPDTTFSEVKKVLSESIQVVKKALKE